MKKMLVITVLLIVLCQFTLLIHNKMQGPIEGKLAVQQLEDSNISYSVGKEVANGGIPKVIKFSFVSMLLVTWATYGSIKLRKKK